MKKIAPLPKKAPAAKLKKGAAVKKTTLAAKKAVAKKSAKAPKKGSKQEKGAKVSKAVVVKKEVKKAVKGAAAKAAVKKAAVKKAAVKKATVKKPAAKKPVTKKAAVKKAVVKKIAAKKPAVKKVATKKVAIKKTPAKKPTVKKVAVKKVAVKKAPVKKVAAKKGAVKTVAKAPAAKKIPTLKPLATTKTKPNAQAAPVVIKETKAPVVHSIPMSLVGSRLDAALAVLFPEHSRARLKGWLDAGFILTDGVRVPGKTKLDGSEIISAMLPEADIETEAKPENIPLDIIFEDEHLLIINKPPGLVVHPGAGNPNGTLLNALLYHAPSLKTVARGGIVHRLDKDTSGVMMVAKTPLAQTSLVRQLQARSASREYKALVHGEVRKAGTIDAMIARHNKDRTKMALVVFGGKEAVTHYKPREAFGGPALKGRHYTLIECKLETGRTHQIRVHMATGALRPLVGDQTYGKRGDQMFHRQALHAWRLTLEHPLTGELMRFTAPMAMDMKILLSNLRAERDNKAVLEDEDWDDDFDDSGNEFIYVRD